MRIAVLVARILLGLIFVVFSLNHWLQFLPMPEMPEAAGALMGALAATGYFFPVLKVTELVGGALVLSGRLAPLGLILLAPVVVQILLFHLFLAPGNLAMAILLVVLEAFVAWGYRGSFRGVLDPGSTPDA